MREWIIGSLIGLAAIAAPMSGGKYSPAKDSTTATTQAEDTAALLELSKELKANQAKIDEKIEAIKTASDTLKDGFESYRPKVDPVPQVVQANELTPDLIRKIVREELDRVTVTLKSGNTVSAAVNQPFTVNPGERIVAVNGVPVSSSSGGSVGGSVGSYSYSNYTRTYSTPTYQVQAYAAPTATQVIVRPQGPIRRAMGITTSRCVTDPVTGVTTCNVRQ